MNKNSFHITIHEAKERLRNETHPFVKLMEDGNMTVEYFAPKVKDTQSPHKQDELYVIVSGSSEFYRDSETINCKKGDILFVPAGMEHRFNNFSEDFATWVIFYGEMKSL
ncbi:MAG: cupin domain-containing protein [Ginsengibacter sp.]